MPPVYRPEIAIQLSDDAFTAFRCYFKKPESLSEDNQVEQHEQHYENRNMETKLL